MRLFLTRSLAVLFALVLILMTLDLLGESGKILAVPGNGDAELWRYVGLRIPLLVSRFLPFSVLLGTLIAFVGLNQHSEVVAMKAAGISAHQILAPLIVASLGIAAALFAFNETVVVKSARVVTAWSDNDYKPVPPDSGVLSNVWLLNGEDMIRAARVAGRDATFRVDELIDLRPHRRILERVIRADRAVPRPASATGCSTTCGCTTPHEPRPPSAAVTGLAGVTPQQLTLAKVDPTELDYWTLSGASPSSRRPAARRRSPAGFAHKISGPALDAADAAARRGRRLRSRPLGPGAAPRDARHGARLRLFRRRQFQPGDGQRRRLPAADRGLGAVPAVPADRRNGAGSDRGMTTRSHAGGMASMVIAT